MKLQTFINRHGVRIETERIDKRTGTASEWATDARHWSVTLYCGRRRMSLEFSQGSAHTKTPTVKDVISCLVSDASGIVNSRNFAEWAGEYGYDEDSRKVEALWKECKRQTVKLREFLGEEDFQFLLRKVKAE
jgi:hypothetical protein